MIIARSIWFTRNSNLFDNRVIFSLQYVLCKYSIFHHVSGKHVTLKQEGIDKHITLFYLVSRRQVLTNKSHYFILLQEWQVKEKSRRLNVLRNDGFFRGHLLEIWRGIVRFTNLSDYFCIIGVPRELFNVKYLNKSEDKSQNRSTISTRIIQTIHQILNTKNS
jgi:hypothetical protein